ncbi:unnamed protein product, partial [Rotaria sp. Silwood2]
IKHLHLNPPIINTIITKLNKKFIKQNIKNKEIHISFSEFAFGRLMNSEHYMNNWNNQLEYHQVRGNDMMNFQYELKHSSSSLSLLNNKQINDNDEHN